MHIEVIHRNIPRLVISILVLATIIVVGCGGDDAVDDPAAATVVPAQPAATSPPAPQATQATPTAQPTAAVQPVVAEVHPGTVTVLNTVWGPELFTTWAWGEVMGYNRQIHSYWMVGSKDLEILPAVATTWEVAPDGLSWVFTIRDGIKFHNGEEVTIDDAVFSMNATYGTNTFPDGTVEEAKVSGGQKRSDHCCRHREHRGPSARIVSKLLTPSRLRIFPLS